MTAAVALMPRARSTVRRTARGETRRTQRDVGRPAATSAQPTAPTRSHATIQPTQEAMATIAASGAGVATDPDYGRHSTRTPAAAAVPAPRLTARARVAAVLTGTTTRRWVRHTYRSHEFVV